MGTLLILQGTANFPVRYRSESPLRTLQRLPAPATEADLVLFLRGALALEQVSVQHLVSEVHRWGSVSMPLNLSVDHERLFVPYDPPAP